MLPGASATLWNMSGTLPDDTGVGDVLHGLVGYSAAPTVLQAILWVVFLGGGAHALPAPGAAAACPALRRLPPPRCDNALIPGRGLARLALG